KGDRGDEAIRALGFRQFRVRFHGDIVRIEVAPEELDRAMTLEMERQFTAIFKPLGFHYVTLDLEGYRQGSLNAVLGWCVQFDCPKALSTVRLYAEVIA